MLRTNSEPALHTPATSTHSSMCTHARTRARTIAGAQAAVGHATAATQRVRQMRTRARLRSVTEATDGRRNTCVAPADSADLQQSLSSSTAPPPRAHAQHASYRSDTQRARSGRRAGAGGSGNGPHPHDSTPTRERNAYAEGPTHPPCFSVATVVVACSFRDASTSPDSKACRATVVRSRSTVLSPLTPGDPRTTPRHARQRSRPHKCAQLAIKTTWDIAHDAADDREGSNADTPKGARLTPTSSLSTRAREAMDACAVTQHSETRLIKNNDGSDSWRNNSGRDAGGPPSLSPSC
jgi:hypothetical protein